MEYNTIEYSRIDYKTKKTMQYNAVQYDGHRLEIQSSTVENNRIQ